MSHNRETGKWACGVVAALVAPTLAVRAEGPEVRAPRKVTVITISMQVGSTEKETKQVTYTPPPGWYVRSHAVDCPRKAGNSSYSVNTVPQNWGWSSEEKISESYRALIDLAAKAHNVGLQNKFAFERDHLLTELRKVRSTHHALVVDATARGEGFLRGGGALQLTVTAELVYLGTEEALARTITRHKASAQATHSARRP